MQNLGPGLDEGIRKPGRGPRSLSFHQPSPPPVMTTPHVSTVTGAPHRVGDTEGAVRLSWPRRLQCWVLGAVACVDPAFLRFFKAKAPVTSYSVTHSPILCLLTPRSMPGAVLTAGDTV